MFLHHFVCGVHFPTVQKHTGIETISHFYWKSDKGVKPANGIQPAFFGDFVIGTQLRDLINSGLTQWRLAVFNIIMDAAAEIGRNPVCKHQNQPEYGDEQADAGRDCRTHLARPNSQARTRTGKYSFSEFS